MCPVSGCEANERQCCWKQKERMKDGQRRKQADRKAKECVMGENKESSRMGNGGQK